MNNEEKNLEGIGGWLILVAIGIIVAPIKLIIFMMTTYPKLFSTGRWEVLTTQGSEVYSPLWAPIIIGEILISSGMLLVWLYISYLFFSKKMVFPKWYIGLAVFNLAFFIIDVFALKLVVPSEPMFNPYTIKELTSKLFMVAVWVPYMLISKRVKATFMLESNYHFSSLMPSKTSKQTSQIRYTWTRFWKFFALLFIVFMIAVYLMSPNNFGINTTSDLLNIVCFLIRYGGPFCLIYFLFALPLTAIIGRIAKSSWRSNIAAVFHKALWPALILALLMLHGLWYGAH